MYVPVALQFQGLAYDEPCAGLYALAGQFPVEGKSTSFHRRKRPTVLRRDCPVRAQSDVAKLRNPMAVESIHTAERAARHDNGTRNEYRLSCTIGEFGRSIHARACLA